MDEKKTLENMIKKNNLNNLENEESNNKKMENLIRDIKEKYKDQKIKFSAVNDSLKKENSEFAEKIKNLNSQNVYFFKKKDKKLIFVK